jgi:hypothetical protein
VQRPVEFRSVLAVPSFPPQAAGNAARVFTGCENVRLLADLAGFVAQVQDSVLNDPMRRDLASDALPREYWIELISE